MRCNSYLLILIFVILSCSSPPKKDKSSEKLPEPIDPKAKFLLTTHTAGQFIISMPMRDALESAKKDYTIKDTTRSIEGTAYQVFEIFYNNELLVQVEPVCELECVIWRIWVHSSRYKTGEGMGVGNTVGEILDVYTFDKIITGEGNVILRVKENEINFKLDDNNFPEANWKDGMKLNEIPKSAKVNSVILV